MQTEASENVETELEEANAAFPNPWRGRFMECAPLEGKLRAGGGRAQGEFFVSLSMQVDSINALFRATADHIIRRRKSCLASKWKDQVSRALRRLRVRSKHGSLEARICVEYARLNSAALRLVLQKHDRVHYSDLGRKYYDSLWKNQRGAADFLHSASLSELKLLVELDCGGAADTQPSPWELVDRSFNCPVCLDTLFRPVALGCGHIFCLPCAKSVAGLENNILSFDALAQKVDCMVLCPECRQPGVFLGAREVTTLDHSIRKFLPEIWSMREKAERKNDCERKARLLGILEQSHGIA